jgi:hypothetical protein
MGTARKKAHTPEAIVAKLRQAEVLVGQGKPVAEAVRVMGGAGHGRRLIAVGPSRFGRDRP